MTKFYVKACENGHPIFAEEVESVRSEFKASEVFEQEPDISLENHRTNYCAKCGAQAIIRCPECASYVQASGKRKDLIDRATLPDYCRKCGLSYPWMDPIENEKQREGSFLNLDDSELNGHFYPSLVYEINLSYRVKADQATLVLTRKLIENLIVDSLRKAFSMDEIELFYDTDNSRTLPLSDLIDNMKERRNDLISYSSGVDEELFRKVDELKYRGDASAHSIEEDASNIDMEEKSKIATEVAKVLFRLRQEAATAHRDR